MDYFRRYGPTMERWTELALGARSGNRHDLERLVDLAYGPTRRLCSTLVDDQSADDLVQETFLRMAKSIGRFRGESSAKTWLFSIAYHVCASELRTRVRHRDHADPRGDLALPLHPTRDDLADQIVVDDLLRRLDPDRRAAFTLTQLYGLSYDETATVCACAPGTVASRVARARHDLIELMARDTEFDDPRVPRTVPERVVRSSEGLSSI
jgi:RNA polymerase sigma-70 factor, ECF subfamily